jgi:hypothetical protein
VKLDTSVAGAIGLLNVAVTWLFVATPVTTGVRATGDVAVTVGAMPTPGLPRIGSSPPPQPAIKVSSNPQTNARRDLEKVESGFMLVPAGVVTASAVHQKGVF